jgi:hypothetical protein
MREHEIQVDREQLQENPSPLANLEPGIRIVSAPRFHTVRPWSERLRVNSGVVIEADHIVCRDDWRPPSEAEATLLTAAEGDRAAALALFNIPQRLHALWWQLAAAEPHASAEGPPAFPKFAGEVIEYLQFKGLPLPPASTLEVILHAPGQPPTWPLTGGMAAALSLSGVLGTVNLSDEESALVFLNQGESELAARSSGAPATTSFLERARTFLAGNSAYPLIRITLAPGEGIWLLRPALLTDADTRGRVEVDVQLVIRHS